MRDDGLVGTWRLVSSEVRSGSGAVAYPFGRDAQGCIVYTADGHVSATIMRRGRPAFRSGDLLGGTVEEKVAAAEGYIAYCGTYRLAGTKVVHHVELSLFPNWIGADQVRFLEREGDRLEIRTAPFLIQGQEQTAVLVFERERSASAAHAS